MNKGMPNTADRLSKLLVSAGSFWPPLAFVLQKLLEYIFARGSEKILVVVDELHIGIVIKQNVEAFSDAEDIAWAKIDAAASAGKILTQEEKDAIDAETDAAFIKLGTMRLRKHGKA
jgi:hypothetical protein